ncbi:hypothetical protein [Nocardia sp. BMG51109]|uniref:hypothetical protein n=1 Tax=Nocardia sp. BMG51109 TaxID=1056816 RepID=UPI000464A601|nr:hypothetical protein [Nocardia sp. BMG51109]
MDRPGDKVPNFPGAGRVYRLIGALYQRPRYSDWPRKLTGDLRWGGAYSKDGRSELRGLPMVYLVTPENDSATEGDNDLSALVTGNIAGFLKGATPADARPPYAHVRSRAERSSTDGDKQSGTGGFEGVPWDEPRRGEFSYADVEAVRNLLWEARNKLVSDDKRGRRLQFPLFSLVYLLMRSGPGEDEPDRDRWYRRLFRQYGVMRHIESAVRTADRDIALEQTRWRAPLWLMYVVTLGIFRLALTGRIPLLSGRYRWFMRQPHLAPDLSGTFVRFADRLGRWRGEDPEYVARLLVNAFLEDLRRGYRLPWWNITRTRRMTYPVLLLDDAALVGGGDRLLWLVNEIRNQTGLFDPLLIVGVGRHRHLGPSRRSSDPAAPTAAVSASSAYTEWRNELSVNRRKRKPITWYLPISLPAPGSATGSSDDGPDGFSGFDLQTDDERKAVRPPLVYNRAVRISGVVILCAGLATIPVGYHRDHCWSFTSSVHRVGAECIGISDGSHSLFEPSDPHIRSVENTIAAQNEAAERLHEDFPKRPYITIAYPQALTSSDGTADSLTAEREGLEGVAAAQQRQLTSRQGDDAPIVRVLIANGGKGMLQAATVARQLGELADRDERLVGVVGLDLSTRATADMIEVLSNAGLPMVASTLSQESLGTGRPMYFQVAPTNKTEAQVVAAFADDHAKGSSGARKVRIYYSDDSADTYSSDLRDNARIEFSAKGFDADPRSFTPGRAADAGRSTCGYDGYVFFAGRGLPDYGDFLDAAGACSSKAVFIGDDDVSRYVAAAPKRQANRTLNFYYASFAVAPPITERNGEELNFYQTLEELFPFERNPEHGRSLDGHAALAYDAAQVLIRATSYLHTGPVSHPTTPGTVWREITDIHRYPTEQRQIDGVSGTIDYGGEITRQVPKDKPVAILQVVHGDVNTDIIGFCGTAEGHTPSAWCPPKEGDRSPG